VDDHPAADDDVRRAPERPVTPQDVPPAPVAEPSPVDLAAVSGNSSKKRSPVPYVFAVVAVLVIVVGAIAVATSGGGGRKVLTLAEAAAKTQSSHTARVEFTTTLPLAGFEGKEVLATGEYDFDRRLMRYDQDITDVLKSTTPNVPAGAGKVTAVGQGYTLYMKMGAFEQIPQLAGKWMKLDLGQQTAALGVDLDKVAEFEGSGPASALAKLQALSGTVETLGTEDVRGVQATHYRATYDFAQVYRDRGAVTDEAAFQKLLALYSSTTATSEAWVDDDGLVRRTVNVIPLKANPQTAKAEFFDFGIKLNVTVPADADTFTPDQLQKIAGGS
jgi:hypothetical protein